MNCLICNQYLANFKAFPGHLTAKHHMTTKEYYDAYLKQENEGICPVCGNETRFININKGYKEFCSLKCATPYATARQKETIKKKYGVDNIMQVSEVQEKVKITMNERYGVDYYCVTDDCIQAGHTKEALEKQKQTCLQHYGVKSGFQTTQCINATHTKEANEKRIKTNNERYGVDYTVNQNNHTEEVNSKRNATNLAKYGYKYNIIRPEIHKKSIENAHTKEAIQKRQDTMRLNGWNNTKIESYFESKLKSLDISYKYNYKSTKYPWKVDFYIDVLDLFIEINNFWTHNNHYYNEAIDLQEKLELDEKAKINDFYKTALNVWTVRDIQKRDWAITHKLNYVVLWNQRQIDQFIVDLQNNMRFIGFIDYNERNI